MQVTTQTGETVTLAMPIRLAVDAVVNGEGFVFIKAIGQDQWWRVEQFYPGRTPELSYRLSNPVIIKKLNAQLP